MIQKLLNRTEFQAMIVGLIIVIFNKHLGLALTEDQAWQIVALIGTYATSRGVAKLGEAKAAAAVVLTLDAPDAPEKAGDKPSDTPTEG